MPGAWNGEQKLKEKFMKDVWLSASHVLQLSAFIKWS